MLSNPLHALQRGMPSRQEWLVCILLSQCVCWRVMSCMQLPMWHCEEHITVASTHTSVSPFDVGTVNLDSDLFLNLDWSRSPMLLSCSHLQLLYVRFEWKENGDHGTNDLVHLIWYLTPPFVKIFAQLLFSTLPILFNHKHVLVCLFLMTGSQTGQGPIPSWYLCGVWKMLW